MKPGDERGDAQCRGVARALCVLGSKTFFYLYRAPDGVLREISLGAVGSLTLAKARDAAVVKRHERREGKDPQLEKRRQRAKAKRIRCRAASAYTVQDLVEEYIAEVLDHQKRGGEGARVLRHDLLSKLGHSPALAVRRRELQH